MNAIEIRGLKKSFRGMYALNGLNMTVPVGSIYVLLVKTEAESPQLKNSFVDILFPMVEQ